MDLIDFEKSIVNTEKLTLPHPRAFERCFVLKPWDEIDENAEIIGKGKVNEIMEKLDCRGIEIYPSRLVVA